MIKTKELNMERQKHYLGAVLIEYQTISASMAFRTGRYAVLFTTVRAGPRNTTTVYGVSKQTRPAGRSACA